MAYNPAASTVNAPTIDYTYTIALETTANKQISDGSGARFVLKTAVISGAPVITAKGKAGAATGGNVLGWAAGSDVLKATAEGDNTSDGNKKYIDIDFSGVEFGAAGVYRYEITEAANYLNTGVVEAASNNHKRYLDVYVRDGSGTGAGAWDVYGYALLTENDTTVDGKTGKTDCFVSDACYTYNVEIGKSLVNDSANNAHQFSFSVDFAGSVTGALPIIAGTASNTTVPAWNAAGAIDTAFDAAETIKIANGGSVTITGIPEGTTLTAREKNDVTGTAYTVVSSGGTTNVASALVISGETTKTSATTQSTVAGTDTYDYKNFTGNDRVTFTNTLKEVSPTGVMIRFAPFILMAVVAVALLIVLTRRRKDKEDKHNAI